MSYWAMYKGDDIITHGTLREIANKLGYEYDYVRWMASPSVRKRMAKGRNSRVLIKVPN